MKESKLSLDIVEAKQNFRDKNIVSISTEDMEDLKISSGDFVLVGNSNKIVFRVIRGEDLQKGKIGIGGIIRSSLDVSLEEKIEVSPIKKLNKINSFEIAVLENSEVSNDDIEKNLIPALKKEENKSFLKQQFGGNVVSLKQRIKVIFPGGISVICGVTRIIPKKFAFGCFNNDVKILISSSVEKGSGVNVYYEDIGGLKEEIEKIREMVEFPMKHPDIFQRLGISAPKGVLLTGPPGTGKTLLAKAVATETDAKFISIAGPEIMSKYHGGSEENLRAKFEDAEKNAPAIIFIDEIDAIAPKRGESHDQTEKRVVAQLLTLMDGLKSRGQLVVMAATNRPDDLDEALRRPGRFDRELKINPPTDEGRKEILKIHTRNMPLDNREKILDEFSKKTLGYTGADLEVLCKEAALRAVKPFYKELVNFGEELESSDEESSINLESKKQKLLSSIVVNSEHFNYALRNVEPSAMREVLINKPNVTWGDIGGLEKAKEKLRELVELPLLRPELFKMAGIKPSKGVLLHGPPGTGKTLLAKAVANEANANFISVKGPELVSKWVGESEKHIREIFKKARQVAPAIIFFDEFDSISKMRGSGLSDSTEKIVNQLLTELDGVEELEKVVIIAATNRKDLIDESLLRAGRIDAHVELPIPDKVTREAIFNVHLKKMPLGPGVDIKKMIDRTEGWTGADIEVTAREAGMRAIKRVYGKKDVKKFEITKDDFDFALKSIGEQIGKGEKEEEKKEMGEEEMQKIMKEMEKSKRKVEEKEVKKKVVKKNSK